MKVTCLPSPPSPHLELHGAQLVHDVTHTLANNTPRNLVLGMGRGFHCMASQFIESNHVLEYSHRLVKRAEPGLGVGKQRQGTASKEAVRMCLFLLLISSLTIPNASGNGYQWLLAVGCITCVLVGRERNSFPGRHG